MTRKRLKKVIVYSFVGIILAITAYNLWAYQGTLLSPFLKDAATDTPHKPLAQVIKEKTVSSSLSDMWLEVTKSQHKLTVYAGKTPLKTYKIALSKSYLEDKQKAGDMRTPEGQFVITEKTEYTPPKRYFGSKLFLLNYPTPEDAMMGFRQGLITSTHFLAINKAAQAKVTPPQDTPLGGGISIHGGDGPFMGDSWTDGSIAMYSKDMDELFEYIPVGFRVVIKR